MLRRVSQAKVLANSNQVLLFQYLDNSQQQIQQLSIACATLVQTAETTRQQQFANSAMDMQCRATD